MKHNQSAFVCSKVSDFRGQVNFVLTILDPTTHSIYFFNQFLVLSISFVNRIKALHAIHNHGMVFFFAALTT